MVRVCVVGSLNADLVIRVPRLPEVGETVTGGVFHTFPGGKGANQAVAAARLGAKVRMVGKVGQDSFGQELRAALAQAGVDGHWVGVDPEAPTGVALIGVEESGRNLIMVAPGANARLRPEDVRADCVGWSDVLLLQLEVPIPTILHAARLGRAAGALVCLDPAPAAGLPDELWRLVDVVTPNRREAQLLAGRPVYDVDSARAAAEALLARGVPRVVIKLGEQGAFYAAAEERGHMPALRVRVVDTTAAGDAFSATLGVALGEGWPLARVVQFATCAAGLKVTRMGAQAMPSREEVEAILGQGLDPREPFW